MQIESLSNQLQFISIVERIDLLKVTDLDHKLKIAKELTASLATLHGAGYVHRNIDRDSFRQVGTEFILDDSPEKELDERACRQPAILGSLDTIAPERINGRLYTGSWFPDDIYALGTIFYELAYGEPVPWHDHPDATELKLDIQERSDAKRAIFSDLLPPDELLKALSCWMLHPDPKMRPNIDELLAALHGLDHYDSLPRFVSMPYDAIKDQPVDQEELESLKRVAVFKTLKDLCPKALQLLHASGPDSYTYLSRKESKSALKVLCSTKKNYLLFLPKKDSAADKSGSYKVGRSAIIIEHCKGFWRARDCFTLTSSKQWLPQAFKHVYKKEMGLYDRFSGTKIFAEHIESALFHAKPHKRLSFYQEAAYSLYEWLEERRSEKETLVAACNIAFQVRCLHETGYAHRDLKLENVLLDEECKAQLCDLDSVVEDARYKHYSESIGTREYIAPERYEYFVASWFPDDIYALGAIFYQMAYSRLLPWDDLPCPDMLEAKIKGIEQDDTSPFKALICLMLQPDREKRPSIQRVYEVLQAIVAAT